MRLTSKARNVSTAANSTSAVKARLAKGKAPVKASTAKTPVKAVKVVPAKPAGKPLAKTILATVGTRGVILCAGTPFTDGSFRPDRDYNGKATGEIMGVLPPAGENVTVQWKGKVTPSARFWRALGAYVSRSGQEPVRVLPLLAALKSGLVQKRKATLGGKTLDAYVPKGWTAAQCVPQYVGCANSTGRLEKYAVVGGHDREGAALSKAAGLTIA